MAAGGRTLVLAGLVSCLVASVRTLPVRSKRNSNDLRFLQDKHVANELSYLRSPNEPKFEPLNIARITNRTDDIELMMINREASIKSPKFLSLPFFGGSQISEDVEKLDRKKRSAAAQVQPEEETEPTASLSTRHSHNDPSNLVAVPTLSPPKNRPASLPKNEPTPPARDSRPKKSKPPKSRANSQSKTIWDPENEPQEPNIEDLKPLMKNDRSIQRAQEQEKRYPHNMNQMQRFLAMVLNTYIGPANLKDGLKQYNNIPVVSDILNTGLGFVLPFAAEKESEEAKKKEDKLLKEEREMDRQIQQQQRNLERQTDSRESDGRDRKT